jgi:hypothetical protein
MPRSLNHQTAQKKGKGRNSNTQKQKGKQEDESEQEEETSEDSSVEEEDESVISSDNDSGSSNGDVSQLDESMSDQSDASSSAEEEEEEESDSDDQSEEEEEKKSSISSSNKKKKAVPTKKSSPTKSSTTVIGNKRSRSEEKQESAIDSSEPKKSRNSNRVIRKPSAADDSSSSNEEDEFSTSQNKRKRAKSNGITSAASSSSGTAASGPVDPDELSDEWRCSANDALTFRLVRPSPEKESKDPFNQVELLNFHPTYTHQLWDDEEIVGYKKVKALVAFTSGALYTYLNAEYESKCTEADVADIQTLIGSKLRGGFTTDYDDFKSHIHDPFTPPGTRLIEYTLPSVSHTSAKEVITYEVYHGHFTDGTLRAYHARLQFFLLFFIDRSSFINDADPVVSHTSLGKSLTVIVTVGFAQLSLA